MADQCIVCLDELDVVPDAINHDDLGDVVEAAPPPPEPTTNPGKTPNQQLIALIKPCGHVLHDECLREWSQKANSCPICRHTFNLVEVLDKVGGKFLDSLQKSISFDYTLCALFLALRMGFRIKRSFFRVLIIHMLELSYFARVGFWVHLL